MTRRLATSALALRHGPCLSVVAQGPTCHYGDLPMNGFYCHRLFDDGDCQGWVGTPDQSSNIYHAWITDGLHVTYLKRCVPALEAINSLLDLQPLWIA